MATVYKVSEFRQGFFQQFWEKAAGQNWGKMINLTSKLGEINNIEQIMGSKIYPQNQVVLDCITQSIRLKHKCLVFSSGLKKKIFFLPFFIGKNRHSIGKKGCYFRLGMGGNSDPREGQKISC